MECMSLTSFYLVYHDLYDLSRTLLIVGPVTLLDIKGVPTIYQRSERRRNIHFSKEKLFDAVNSWIPDQRISCRTPDFI